MFNYKFILQILPSDVKVLENRPLCRGVTDPLQLANGPLIGTVIETLLALL